METIIEFDKSIFLFLHNLGTESWDSFWIFVSDKPSMFLCMTPIILFCCWKYEAKNLVYPIVGVLICFVLTDLIHLHLFKNIFMRLRPCHEIGVCEYTRLLVDCGGYYGFVSGHAANSSALVLFLLMYFKSMHQFMKYFLIAWVLLVAYSRIYLGKHYPLDLIFGILLGCLIAFLFFRIFFYITKSSK